MNSWTIDKKNEKQYLKVKLSGLHLTKKFWNSLKSYERHIYSDKKLKIKATYAIYLALVDSKKKMSFDEFYVEWLKDFLGKKELWAYGE